MALVDFCFGHPSHIASNERVTSECLIVKDMGESCRYLMSYIWYAACKQETFLKTKATKPYVRKLEANPVLHVSQLYEQVKSATDKRFCTYSHRTLDLGSNLHFISGSVLIVGLPAREG
jgi:hypothetical protein